MKDQIRVVPDPVLRQKAEKVGEITDEVRQIIEEMRKASLDWERDHPHEMSAAMAAPQLGYSKQIVIVRENNDDKDDASFVALINPTVIRTSSKTKRDYEGCLSVPDIYGMIERPEKATIEATMENGDEVRIKATDGTARVLLHEIDHMNGVLFIDHIRGQKKAFYRLDDDGKLQQLDYSEVENNKSLWGGE
ncbi:peptide deformylase [Candidatus Saccharibacteria bacterium]|nr:peptide deformylase [Candidatus Saccharibacteria bacterium]